MSGKNVIRDKDTVAQLQNEEARGWVVDETPELRRSVEQEIQGKVDTNHPDSCRASMTLEQEEKAMAQDIEIARTRARVGEEILERERQTRLTVEASGRQTRRQFQKRAASVDGWQDPERADPRTMLSQEGVAAVNEQAARLVRKLDGWTKAAVSRRLAERLVDGRGMTDAVVDVYNELETAAGTVIPIAKVGEVKRSEVSIEGEVETLWESSSSAIQQVGLIKDDSGRIKFTSWKKSDVPFVSEGEQIAIRIAAKNWYQGRVSIALTGWSRIVRQK